MKSYQNIWMWMSYDVMSAIQLRRIVKFFSLWATMIVQTLRTLGSQIGKKNENEISEHFFLWFCLHFFFLWKNSSSSSASFPLEGNYFSVSSFLVLFLHSSFSLHFSSPLVFSSFLNIFWHFCSSISLLSMIVPELTPTLREKKRNLNFLFIKSSIQVQSTHTQAQQISYFFLFYFCSL